MRAALSIFAAAFACTAAHAADWSWQPALEWRVDHQSNRSLSAQDAQDSQAGWLSLEAALERATPETVLSLRPHFELRRSTGERPLNTEDGSLELAGKWMQEYSTFSASADVARQSTLTTELAETGIVDVDARRELRNAKAAWSWQFTRESRLDAQLGYSDVEYPDAESLGLVGYRYPNASLGVSRQLSSYTAWSLTAFASRVEAPDASTTSRDIGVQAGVTRDLSPTTQLQLGAGMSDTQRSNLFETRTDRSNVWNALFSRAFESGRLNISLARSLAPNGRGLLARRDEAVASLGRVFGPRLTGGLTVRAIRNVERLSAFFPEEEYRYRSAEAALNRSFAQNWTVSVRAGSNDARRRIADTDAKGWYAACALRWAPQAQPVRLWDLP